jgi:hypothetical protein
MILMTQRSSMGELKRRLSPHPTKMPRTAWQKFNRAKTDSGWPLLVLNFCSSAFFAALFTHHAISAHLLSVYYWWLSVGCFVRLLQTGYVMVCVVRGQVGRLAPAPEAPGPSPDTRRYRGRHT